MRTIRTLCDIPLGLPSIGRKPDQILFKDRGAWRAIPTTEFCGRVAGLAAGLADLGVRPGDRVALLSENRPEWTATDLAILCAGGVTVPIYTSLTPEQIAFVLRDSGAAVVVASTPEQTAKVVEARAALPSVRELIAMDPAGAPVPGVRAWHDVAEMHASGAEERCARLAAAVRPESLASIIYTSGTTGMPKGVMLTHANFVHNIVACCAVIPFQPGDVCLSFLPLSHVYERLVEFCYLHTGSTVAYAESIDAVPRNIQEIRPTITCGVPRVFEKMYRRVLDTGAALPPPRRQIFRWASGVARRVGRAAVRDAPPGPWLRLQRAVADRLVYRALRERLGGRLRFFISGGAPLQKEIAEFFYGAGVLILEGYGLTETSPVITLNRPGAFRFGTVGRPLPGIEVTVAADGEILTRSPSVMRGYFGDDQATREALRDGWLCTGDIGRIDEDGYLLITDRKKELLKTSGGKMVAPQPIENLLRADRFVAQAVVVGDRRRFPAALIVPAFDQLATWARARSIPCDDPRALLADPRVAALFEERLERVNAKLARYERIKKFCLLEREFTQEADEITPTLKYRRKVIEQRYRDRIDRMYAEPPAAGAAG